MSAESALTVLLGRLGLSSVRDRAAASEYSDSLLPVIDAVAADPQRLWRTYDGVQLAKVVSAFNLDRILKKATGFDFMEYVDRCRVGTAIQSLARQEATVEEIAEAYWPPRTRTQQLKELHANVAVIDNKLSSLENLDAAFRRTISIGLDEAIRELQGR